MSQFKPNRLYPGSPDEFILFLDSVINSSLCPHTKDRVCFCYINFHEGLCQFFDFSMHAFPENSLFTIQYGGSDYLVPFRIHDLITYIEDFPGLTYPILRLAQAKSVKRYFSTEWDAIAREIAWRIPLPAWVKCRDTGGDKTWDRFNPAVWFALQEKGNVEDLMPRTRFSASNIGGGSRLILIPPEMGNASGSVMMPLTAADVLTMTCRTCSGLPAPKPPTSPMLD
jgi:hypothetical protein